MPCMSREGEHVQEPDTPRYLVGLRRGILTMIILLVLVTCVSMHFAAGQ